MKVSYNWLKSYIDFDQSPEELADILTMLGLETSGIEEFGGVPGNFEGVVVGHVLSAEQHPNADKLRVCKVDVGQEEPLNIVCGAPNVAAGQKVPVATVGTKLHPFNGEPLKIKKGKIRGEVSMGMICAEDELGLGEDHEGIMVLEPSLTSGTPFNEVVKIEKDDIIEIDLTPNRIDGASHYGVARDLAAYFRTKATLPTFSLSPDQLADSNPIPVEILARDKCKRYTSLYLEGVTVGESPEWLKKRLLSIGLRPRNLVVDVTNFVLMELGQPMHAFDADQIEGKQIIVRTLDKATSFITLDDQTHTLLPDQDLLICDQRRPLCIAGTMGGLNSAVTTDTKNVFLEAAYFDPSTVRKTAKRLGIHSDSSFRFERGVDPHMTVNAILRATELIMQEGGGKPSKIQDVVVDEFPHFPVELTVEHAQRLIGKALSKEEIISILRSLEMKVTAKEHVLEILVPPYRVDVKRPQDVIEEILRVYGYNKVEPSIKINSSIDFQPDARDIFGLRQRYCDYLSASGYYEILTNSLVAEALTTEHSVPMLNPLSSDQAVLRISMLPGALETVQHNQNRQQEDLSLYEYGKTYFHTPEGYDEKEWITLIVTGQKHTTHWEGKSPKVSLYTLGKEVEKLQRWFKIEGTLMDSQFPDFDYGLDLVVKDKILLSYGKITSELTEVYDLRNDIFYMQIDWLYLADLYYQSDITFREVPVYPSIRRDISMLIDDDVMFADIKSLIQQVNSKLIRSVELHDVYRGQGIQQGKKSYLVSFELRDDKKSLSNEAADKIASKIYRKLTQEVQAEIRGKSENGQ